MADDVLHAAVVEQDALVLEAGVAAHGSVAFDRFTREAPPACCFCAFLGSLVDAAICSTARREQLPESLRPRLLATRGTPVTFDNRNARR